MTALNLVTSPALPFRGLSPRALRLGSLADRGAGQSAHPMQLAAPPQVAISVGALVVPGMAPHHDLRLTTSRQAGRQAKSRHMIAAEGLAAVGRMIAAYRRSDGAATDYEIARVTVALRILRVMDDV